MPITVIVFTSYSHTNRMRRYIRRGSVSNHLTYRILRKDVWEEVYSLLTEGVVLHDADLQQIAMIKADEKGLREFKVSKQTPVWPEYFTASEK